MPVSSNSVACILAVPASHDGRRIDNDKTASSAECTRVPSKANQCVQHAASGYGVMHASNRPSLAIAKPVLLTGNMPMPHHAEVACCQHSRGSRQCGYAASLSTDAVWEATCSFLEPSAKVASLSRSFDFAVLYLQYCAVFARYQTSPACCNRNVDIMQ